MARLTTVAARLATLPLAGLLVAGVGAGVAQAAPASHPRPIARCTTARLGAGFRRFSAGAGQRYFTLVLTNRSHRTCFVSGYPGLRFVGRRGTPPRVRVQRTRMRHGMVVLRPGRAAHSCLSWEAIQGPFVHPARVRITLHGVRGHLTRRWHGGPIGMHRIRITPLKAGRNCP